VISVHRLRIRIEYDRRSNEIILWINELEEYRFHPSEIDTMIGKIILELMYKLKDEWGVSND